MNCDFPDAAGAAVTQASCLCDPECEYRRTLAVVRDLSENATLRPSPRRLRCVAWKPFTPTTRSATLSRINTRIQIRELLRELSLTGRIQ